ncbi:hypothetical protein ACLE23_004724 [Pseudomonas aeruginosa]|nr:hypothetical protein [Pseudomonas aeruginosa]
MQLHEAHEVKEVYGASAANAAIVKGWKLLAITAAHELTDPFSADHDKLKTVYVLGRRNADPQVTRD